MRSKWDVSIKAFLPRVRNLCRRVGRKSVWARGSRCFQGNVLQKQWGDVYMNSQNSDTMLKTCTDSSQTKVQLRDGERGKFLPLTKKPFAIDTFWDRENLFSPMEKHSMAGLLLRSGWSTQNRLHDFMCASFGYGLGFCPLFSFEREKIGKDLGWLGGGERIWSKCTEKKKKKKFKNNKKEEKCK